MIGDIVTCINSRVKNHGSFTTSAIIHLLLYTLRYVYDLCLGSIPYVDISISMKIRNNKQSITSTVIRGFRSLKASEQLVLFVMAFSTIGVALVLTSQAASNTFNVSPESGNQSGSVSTESDPSGGSYVRFGATYQDIYVSTSGNDSNNGTSTTQPVKTITKAVQLASASTRIRIMAGTYIETVKIQKSNLKIEPYGNGDVIINGAIPELISGVNWTYVQPGIYKRNLGRDESRSDGSNIIYGRDGQQQWTYPDLLKLLGRGTVNNLPGVYVSGFALDQAVYVATDTGQPPSAPLYVGAATPTLDIKNSSNIRINSVNNSKLKLMYGSYNISLRNSDNIRVNDVDITGGHSAILAFDSSNVSITNNYLHGTFGRTWDWSDVKEGNSFNTMENQALQIKALSKDISDIVVDGNDMSGYFNGVNFDHLNPYFINDSVISNNRIHDSIDDGIEIDAVYKNLVVKGNMVYDVYSPFSSTGGAVGPVDVYENVFVANRVISDNHGTTTKGPGYPIKMNNIDGPVDKNIHFYQNTFYYAGGGGDGRYTVHSTPGKETSNVSFIDNIFYSYGGGLLRGTGRAQDSVDWDGNLFFSVKDDPSTPWDDNYWSWDSYYNPDNVNNYSSLSQIVSDGKMPYQWQGNTEGNPNFNCVDPLNSSCFRASASISKPASKQPIPTSYSESSRLNSRARLGAFE